MNIPAEWSRTPKFVFNARRQVLSPLVLISRDVSVQIEKAAPADPFASPIRPVSTLLQFSPSTDYKHRVHVRGIVTHQQPGSYLWLRDQGSGLRVQSRQPETLRVGDDVDVVGYVHYGAAVPVLEDCLFRRRGGGPAPEPVKLNTPDEALDHEEDLISVDATLTEA